jgi:hypothetical protein
MTIGAFSAPRDRSADWVARALASLQAVVARDAQRYARHLERQHRLDDPREAVLALAARRLLPLGRAVQRALPAAGGAVADLAAGGSLRDQRARGAVLGLAFRELSPADRRLLASRVEPLALRPDDREHLAAALLRLTKKAQAARRDIGAPPAGPQFLVFGSDPDPHPGWSA